MIISHRVLLYAESTATAELRSVSDSWCSCVIDRIEKNRATKGKDRGPLQYSAE